MKLTLLILQIDNLFFKKSEQQNYTDYFNLDSLWTDQ